MCASDEKVQVLLCKRQEFEGPAGAKHLIGLVEFRSCTAALTLYGDSYSHRQGMREYCEMIEKEEGRNEFLYSTGFISFSELIERELVGVCIDDTPSTAARIPEPSGRAMLERACQAVHLIGAQAECVCEVGERTEETQFREFASRNGRSKKLPKPS